MINIELRAGVFTHGRRFLTNKARDVYYSSSSLSVSILIGFFFSLSFAPANAQTFGGAGGSAENGMCRDSGWGGAGGGFGENGESLPPLVGIATCGGIGGGGGGADGGLGGLGSDGHTAPGPGPGSGKGGDGGTGGALGFQVSGDYGVDHDLEGGPGERGGDGADSSVATGSGGGGGGGGAGGYGLIVDGAGAITITNDGYRILGGAGGDGGNGGNNAGAGVDGDLSGDGGSGGDGGIGIWLRSGSGAVVNNGTVQGGKGGDAGAGGRTQSDLSIGGQTGNAGAGGAGIYRVSGGAPGDTITLTNSGTIKGGDAGASASEADTFWAYVGASGNNGGDGVRGVVDIDNSGFIQGGNGSDASVGNPLSIDLGPTFTGSMGGNGGAGVIVPDGHGIAAGTIRNSGRIIAGHGGNGGDVASPNVSNTTGNGGNGGVGIAAANRSMIENEKGSLIQGGDGGNGGYVTNPNGGNAGNGGYGIDGAGITVINAGTIIAGQAGQAGSGTAQTIGNIAIHMGVTGFAGDGNALELRPGSSITGMVIAEIQNYTSNVFTLSGESADGEGVLPGDISQTVDGSSAYQGFQIFDKKGTSTWTLQGVNDGEWTIWGGVLQVGDGGQLNGSTIHTSASRDYSGFLSYKQTQGTVSTFGGKITGFGGFRQAGEGTIELTNAGNDYTGETQLNAGEISVSSDDILGAAISELHFNGGLLKVTGTQMKHTDRTILWGGNGGGFDIDVGNTFTVSQNLGGSGSGHDGLIKEGLGTLVLTGANTYRGMTTITGGVLQVGDGGANGALGSGAITNNGSLVFDSSSNVLVQGKINGSGDLEQRGSGTTTLASDSSYTGQTKISDGTLQLGNNGTTGSVSGDIINNKMLIIDRGDVDDPYDFDNKTTGSGEVVVAGSGTVKFTNESNNYSGGTVLQRGTLQIGSDAVLGDHSGGLTFKGGTLSVESGFTTDRSVNIATNGVFDVNAGVKLELTGAITGDSNSSFDKQGTGRLIIGEDDSSPKSVFEGTANVSAGVMEVDRDFGGKVNVNSGGAIGGEGSVGATIVADGGTLIGAIGKKLTFNDGLSLKAGGTVDVTIGADPSDNAMFDVQHGVLDLNGTLNVSTDAPVGIGVYRIFDYNIQDGLTGNGLTLGTVNSGNPGDWSIQSVPSQINLINSGGLTVQYWDGEKTNGGTQVQGGSGFWNGMATNWTSEDGSQNNGWIDGTLAIFTAQAGVVTIAEPVSASGLVFQTSGYEINGDTLTLTGDGTDAPVIQVGYSDYKSAAFTTTIDAVLNGHEGLNKTGNGELILTKDAQYTGLTTVTEGTLSLGNGGAEGLVNTDIDLAGSKFGGSTLVFDLNKEVTFDHSITGTGEVVQRGTGTTIFSGQNNFSGGLSVKAGKAQAGVADTAFGTGRVTIEKGATLDLAGFNETIGGLVGDNDGDGDIVLGAGTLTLNQDFDDQFSGAISGTGGIVKNENGKLTLFGTNNYSGETILNDGFLVQGAQGAFSNASAYTVAKGSTLDLNGFSTNMVSLNSVGKVDFGGTGGTQLTIAGDYIGGGTLVMNTVLGTDNSETDMLRVAGNTSGTTTIVVNNPKGGLGAATVNGIELIDIAGNSGGKFYLQGDYTTKDGQPAILTSSAYAYTLQKGDASGSNTNDWYLVSQYTRSNPDGPNPPACDDPNGCPENPTNPSGPSRFSPAAPVYTSYAASMQALNQLPTLQQRRGDRYLNKSGSLRGSSEAGETDDRAIWARIEGAHNRLEPNTTAGHVQQDINTVIMQAGVDGQFYEDESGRLIAGITGQYGNGRARTASNFDDVNGGGELNTQGWGLGGTVTWYGNDGFYVDGQAQANWYKTDLRFGGGNNGLTNDNNGFGYAFSVESGKRFDIDENWSLTPQAQLMFSSVDFDTFSDSYGATVSNRDGNSLNGRLGLAANYANSWQGADSRMVNANVYGIANLYQEFLGGTSINYGGTRMKADQDRTWAGVGFGGTYAWADNKYSVYGEGTVNTSLNHFADSYAVKGNVGFKVNW